MEQEDLQLRAEIDRTLVAHLITQMGPQFRKDRAGCMRCWEQMQAAIKALYGHDLDAQISGRAPEVMLVTMLVRDIQAQCHDLAHALEILELLRFTIDWQYQ